MEFFDWSFVGTFTGALMAVTLFTELLKSIPKINALPTQLVSWIIAYAVILLSQVFGGGVTVSGAALGILNAGLVSLAANGGYDAIKKIMDSNKK